MIASEKPTISQANASIEFALNGLGHGPSSYHNLAPYSGIQGPGAAFVYSSRSAIPVTSTPTYRTILAEKHGSGLPRRLRVIQTTLVLRYYLVREDCTQSDPAMVMSRASVKD